MILWAHSTDMVKSLSHALEHRLGISSTFQWLLYGGKQLEDSFPLSFYNIWKYASVVLTLWLRGGAIGQRSSTQAFSYKDVVHAQPIKKVAQPSKAPKPFWVDKLEDVPYVEISHPALENQFQIYAESSIIYRFNGLWPHMTNIYQWVHSSDLVKNLSYALELRLGIPSTLQRFLYGGK